MRTTVLSISLLLPLIFSTAIAEEFDKDKAVSEVKAITKQFATSLKSELVAAMQSGGPSNALNVCNIEAMPITTKVSDENSALVSRVSLKNRNPGNVPNDWQRKVLEDFDKRAADGESIEQMGAVNIIEHDGKKQIRFMKALPTGGACLACHGEQLSPDVKTKLSELYPDDKATGYQLGQVRGAIVVIKEY